MSIYLSVAQAQNIVFELMEIIPKGVSVADENGYIIASSNTMSMGKVSSLAKYSLQGTTQGRYLTGGVPPVRFSM